MVGMAVATMVFHGRHEDGIMQGRGDQAPAQQIFGWIGCEEWMGRPRLNLEDFRKIFCAAKFG